MGHSNPGKLRHNKPHHWPHLPISFSTKNFCHHPKTSVKSNSGNISSLHFICPNRKNTSSSHPLFLFPVTIISLFFVIYACFLSKTTLHPSSHSCGTEMREAPPNLGNTCVFSAFEVRLVLEDGSLPSLLVFVDCAPCSSTLLVYSSPWEEAGKLHQFPHSESWHLLGIGR